MSTPLQNKLLNYAPEPPAESWNRISSALDEGAASLAGKLYSFEADPPPHIWDSINEKLHKDRKAGKLVIFYPPYRKAVQYSAAAMLLIALSFTASLMVGKKTESANLVVVNEKKVSSPSGNNTGVSNDSAEPSLALANEVDVSGYPSGKKAFQYRLKPRLNLGSIAFARTFIPPRAEEKTTITANTPQEKYMVYSDGKGHAMKVPKKLFEFMACVQEELLCKQQMQALQQKLAETSLTADFTGVLELLQNLQENQ